MDSHQFYHKSVIIAHYLKSMNTFFKINSATRSIIAIVAAMIIGLAGMAAPVFAGSTDTPAPQIPMSYTRVDANGSIQGFTITQFNGRGRFHAAVVVDGISYIGYGRYNALNDTLSVKWYSFSAAGIASLRGSFAGNLSSDYQVFTGAYARLDQTGLVRMKAG